VRAAPVSPRSEEAFERRDRVRVGCGAQRAARSRDVARLARGVPDDGGEDASGDGRSGRLYLGELLLWITSAFDLGEDGPYREDDIELVRLSSP